MGRLQLVVVVLVALCVALQLSGGAARKLSAGAHRHAAPSPVPAPGGEEGGEESEEPSPVPTPTLDEVLRENYVRFPYPPRDEEQVDFITKLDTHASLAFINHWVYDGQRNFVTEPLRVLVAGGGTGDATVQLMRELWTIGAPGDVYHVDFSAPAVALAEARVHALRDEVLAKNKAHNVTLRAEAHFFVGDVNAVGSLGAGTFDVVEACNVIERLPMPPATLAVWHALLRDDGALLITAHAERGRRGERDVGELVELVAPAQEIDVADRVTVARQLVRALHPTSWFLSQMSVADVERMSDAEVAERFLMPRGHAFSIEHLLSLMNGAGFKVSMFHPAVLYDPLHSVRVGNRELRNAIKQLGVAEGMQMAALHSGALRDHTFVALKAGNARSSGVKVSAKTIPVFSLLTPATAEERVGAQIVWSGPLLGRRFSAVLSDMQFGILSMVDSVTTLGQMFARIRTVDPELTWDEFLGEFTPLFSEFSKMGRMLLGDALSGSPALANTHLNKYPVAGKRRTTRAATHGARAEL